MKRHIHVEEGQTFTDDLNEMNFGDILIVSRKLPNGNIQPHMRVKRISRQPKWRDVISAHTFENEYRMCHTYMYVPYRGTEMVMYVPCEECEKKYQAYHNAFSGVGRFM